MAKPIPTAATLAAEETIRNQSREFVRRRPTAAGTMIIAPTSSAPRKRSGT